MTTSEKFASNRESAIPHEPSKTLNLTNRILVPAAKETTTIHLENSNNHQSIYMGDDLSPDRLLQKIEYPQLESNEKRGIELPNQIYSPQSKGSAQSNIPQELFTEERMTPIKENMIHRSNISHRNSEDDNSKYSNNHHSKFE